MKNKPSQNRNQRLEEFAKSHGRVIQHSGKTKPPKTPKEFEELILQIAKKLGMIDDTVG